MVDYTKSLYPEEAPEPGYAPSLGFAVALFLLLLAAVAVFIGTAGCAPPCELREVMGCEFTPAHSDTQFVCLPDFDGNLDCRWETDHYPDRWQLIYRKGWPRDVDPATCNREREAARHKRRWEFRDGSRYTYVDKPLAECTSREGGAS